MPQRTKNINNKHKFVARECLTGNYTLSLAKLQSTGNKSNNTSDLFYINTTDCGQVFCASLYGNTYGTKYRLSGAKSAGLVKLAK